MKIPRYWKQTFKSVEGITFHKDYFKQDDKNNADIYAWGYSDISEQDALEKAELRVEQIIKALCDGVDDNFYYPLSVLRETILEELNHHSDNPPLVTRNRYFSKVLNTMGLMFIDIDVPEVAISPPTFWQKLWGKAQAIEAKNKLKVKNRFAHALTSIEQYIQGQSEAGFLVYRTFAGFRLIASHKTFNPNSKEAQQIFDALGADPLYQKLCKAQECFRARLTPKFWRLGKNLGTSPSLKFRITKSIAANWSKHDEVKVKEYDDWITQYENNHTSHATCQFVKHMGNPQIAKELEYLINYHDKETQAHSGKPLA